MRRCDELIRARQHKTQLLRAVAMRLDLDCGTLHRPRPAPLGLSDYSAACSERGMGAPSSEPVQGFGSDMRVPAQHLPILVAGDQRDLFDGEARLE